MTELDSAQAFAEWLASMQPVLAGFEDFAMPVGWTRGFTRQSLVELEAFLLDSWQDENQYLATADGGFVDAAGRYLGETYLRVAGGGWQVDLDDDALFARQPVVVTVASEGVPLAPYSLITAALHRRTGTELDRVYDNLVGEIEELKGELGSGWQPPRLPVPGITEGTAAEELGSPETRAWVHSVDGRLESLRLRLGGDRPAALDLTPASLQAVEEAALTEFDRDDVDVHAPTDRHQQYVAYLGTTLLRAAGGRWVVRPGNPDDNLFLGNPYVYREDEDGDPRAATPLYALKHLLSTRQRGSLAEALADFAKEY